MATGGLLSMFDKTCPDGHGPLEQVPGTWAFHGVIEMGRNLNQEKSYTGNNKVAVVTLWRCETCKLMRSYAID